jgi:EAL domain-containing protein (putative c-di-GMP-specific phosphodiesterase class I)
LKHWEHLRELRCDLGQGYLFSPPVEPKAAGKLLLQSAPSPRAKVAGA